MADHEGLAQKPFKGYVDIVVQLVERASGVIIAEFVVSLFRDGKLLVRKHLAFRVT